MASDLERTGARGRLERSNLERSNLDRGNLDLGLLPPPQQAFLLAGFRSLSGVPAGLEPHLAGVLADVLAHPGSLARAQLAFAVLRRLGVRRAPARELAVALEYFHTASLLFDDLPAMDDAGERRGRPCPHLRWGEGAAILGALALITRAYELLWGVVGTLPMPRRRWASELVASCLGPAGILDGQALDLHFQPGEADAEAVARVAAGKTVPLVRLALVLPALVGGAGEAELSHLDGLATAWGLAYQAVDDAKDCLLSAAEVGKSTSRDRALGRPNLPVVAGWTETLARLDELLAEGREHLAALAAERPGWRRLAGLQAHLEREARALRLRRCA